MCTTMNDLQGATPLEKKFPLLRIVNHLQTLGAGKRLLSYLLGVLGSPPLESEHFPTSTTGCQWVQSGKTLIGNHSHTDFKLAMAMSWPEGRVLQYRYIHEVFKNNIQHRHLQHQSKQLVCEISLECPPTDGWMKRMWFYPAKKKNKIVLLADSET